MNELLIARSLKSSTLRKQVMGPSGPTNNECEFSAVYIPSESKASQMRNTLEVYKTNDNSN